MKHLAMYNTTSKIVQNLEDYLETDMLKDKLSAYDLNRLRYIAECKNRGLPWKCYDGDTEFHATIAGYTGGALPNSIIFIGDSRTHLWLETTIKYFTEYTTVTNRGIGGSTAHDQSAWIPTWGLARHEKAVISIGVNDHLLPWQDTVTALQNIVNEMKGLADKVYLTSIPTVNNNYLSNPGTTLANVASIRYHALQVDSYIPAICQAAGITFMDLAGLLQDTNGYLNPSYDDGSGIHYNAAGYAAIRAFYKLYGI